MMTKIYHNPRCRKSRETLQILEGKNESIEIVEYLNEPPSKDELKKILDMLGMKPEALLRKGESIYKEQFKGKQLTDEEWIDAMIQNPKLIERPIVIKNGKAALGRPPENVTAIL
ncbi:MAG: arsenate reductase (glutaredoxin) [Flammeovirgaceae bacterium]|nr:arsenate reductase (glutaredoxin) [Flammeovirgaceae bacterium]MBE63615.1 arsenate reductase (glutaredoxin) [Flammeovirgaceae bacterium]MBR10191.1 arsenate reductase (glutaredoxin) [Rickettsiales bacterium]